MTVSEKLSYAILALDSYNRGYDPGVKDLGGIGSAVGNFTFVKQSEVLLASSEVAASFYAAAYQDSTGNIVISYRGTDALLSDPFTGWTTGAGYLSAQAKLAAEFYYQVKDAFPGKVITLTGHSLGGGLSGLVDNMPFAPVGRAFAASAARAMVA